MFPGGTITGCPKVRCMEIIEELEPLRRSLFYGSCGYLDWRGNLDLNILIRTLLVTPSGNTNYVWGQVGAGIVADSDPETEWYESSPKSSSTACSLGSLKSPILNKKYSSYLFTAKARYYRHNLPNSLESWYYLRQDLMNTENYLTHPTFGLLSRVCVLEQNQELFTTLYAQRLFFLVTQESPAGGHEI